MLTLLKIKNVALIDDLTIEFGSGLNLLTGETGSGKSIIVDSLGALTGERVSNDIVKQGEDSARIEGVFSVATSPALTALMNESGIELENTYEPELIIRRDISLAGKNRVFINDQLATQAFLRSLGSLLADIHGQGEQAALYDVNTHIAMLDAYAGVEREKAAAHAAYRAWSAIKAELAALEKDESEKLQLVDILRFQVNEIKRADLKPGEDAELEEGKRRLNNVEKLSSLSSEAHALLYDDESSALATLDRAAKIITELGEYDSRFRGFDEGLDAARAVAEELGRAARDFGSSLEFSPERLDEIEHRLAEISGLKRKYGESIDVVLEHLRLSEERLNNIETAEFREEELRKQLEAADTKYLEAASRLHDRRAAAAAKFSKQVEQELKAVALEKAKFEVRIDDTEGFSPNGTDRVEFYFSANPGEELKPLAKIASGGEASRLMLVLKTVANAAEFPRTIVFDEIDTGIGGRVSETLGAKLKKLSLTNQVLCITHQAQIARFADCHLTVQKMAFKNRTRVTAERLERKGRIEELARMLTGAEITANARRHAEELLEQ